MSERILPGWLGVKKRCGNIKSILSFFSKVYLGFFFARFSCFIFLIFLLSFSSYAFSGLGSGTYSDPYQLTNCTQLTEINQSLTSNYTLANNIDCSDTYNWNSGAGFIPIKGNSVYFSGILNGQGYNISNLYINRSSQDDVGMFYFLSSGAKIHNLGLTDVNISGHRYVGALAGYQGSGSLVNFSFSTGTVSGTYYEIGGLIGSSGGNISYSYSTCTVYGLSNMDTGGLLGSGSGVNVNYCYAAGNVYGYQRVGGVIGEAYTNSIINNTYFAGNVNGSSDVGGILGNVYGGRVENSYSIGNVTSASEAAGIAAFCQSGTIFDGCYAYGNISGGSGSTGGIVAYMDSSGYIKRSFSNARISGGNTGGILGYGYGINLYNVYSFSNLSGSSVGGIVGYHYFGDIFNSYFAGKILSASKKGGIVGDNYWTSSCISSFWDNLTCNITTNYCLNGSVKLDTDMKSVSTYTSKATPGLNVSWDFVGNLYDDFGINDTWDINPSINDGYPYLVGVAGMNATSLYMQINYPIYGRSYDFVSDINYTFTSINIPDSCWYSNESGWNSSVFSAGTNITGISILEGWNNYTLYCNDSIGAFNSRRTIFYVDLTFPWFTAIANQTVEVGQNFSQKINATDNNAVSCFSVNDTVFRINCTGGLRNNTYLNASLYLLNITVNDTVNRIASQLIWINITDTAAPIINITYPRNNTNYSVNINSLNYTVRDFGLMDKCWYSNDSGISNSAPNNARINFTNVTTFEGWNNFTVYCNDTFSNIGYSVANFFKDTTAPVFTYYSNQTTEAGNYFSLQINATEENTLGCFRVNDTGKFKINCSGFLENNSLLTLGTYRLNITVNDTFGNKNSAYIFVNVTDTTPPIVNITIPRNNSYYSYNITINYTVRDLGILSRCWYSNNSGITNSTSVTAGTNFSNVLSYQGENNWTVYCNDSLKNTGFATVTFIKDLIKPYFVNLTNLSASFNNPFSYQINASDNYGVSCFTVNDTGNFKINCAGLLENNTFLSAGVYWVNITVNDTASNKNSSMFFVNVSSTAPQITILYPNNNGKYVSNINRLNYTLSSGIPIDSCWYSNDSMAVNSTLVGCANISNQIWTDGQHNVTVYANDTSENVGSATVSFSVDTILPVITTTSPLNSSYSSNTALDVTYMVLDANIDKCWYSNDSMAVNSTLVACANITTVVWTNGIHNVVIWANDTFGNINYEFVSFTIDSISPSLSIISPINNSYSTNTGLDISYVVSDANLDKCWYSNDSMSVNSTLASCINMTLPTWTEGRHNITLWANDSAGNLNYTFLTFTIDTIIPSVSIISPENLTYSNDSGIDVRYIVSDANLDKCWYSNDSMNVNSTLASCANITTVTWTNGQHNVTIYTNDSSSNTNSVSVSFIIDTAKPSVNLISPANGYVDNRVGNANVFFNITLSDNILLKNVSLYMTNRQNTSFSFNQSQNSSGTFGIINWTIYLENGNYTWGCIAYDFAGNYNWSVNYSMTINATPDTDNDGLPDIADTVLYNESNVSSVGISNLNITINGNKTNETFSGVQEIKIYDSSTLIVNYTYNFSSVALDLSKIKIKKAATYVIVNVSNQTHGNKSIYIQDTGFISLCVKDSEIDSITEMTSGCNGQDETLFTSCLGSNTTINATYCIDLGTTIRFDNLRHSAVRGTEPTPAVDDNNDGPSNGGSATTVCTTNWTCSSWSICNNGIQTRNCTKEIPSCYASLSTKPVENQTCQKVPMAINTTVDDDKNSTEERLNKELKEEQKTQDENIALFANENSIISDNFEDSKSDILTDYIWNRNKNTLVLIGLSFLLLVLLFTIFFSMRKKQIRKKLKLSDKIVKHNLVIDKIKNIKIKNDTSKNQKNKRVNKKSVKNNKKRNAKKRKVLNHKKKLPRKKNKKNKIKPSHIRHRKK